MGKTLREIFQAAYRNYASQRGLPAYQRRAARALMRCRTAALGGHAEVCPEGHVNGVWYNSCRHRSCPQCSYQSLNDWLDKKRELLLDTSHYQIVFTLPHEYLPLWRWNRRTMADLLFRSARHTLMTLLGDRKYLDAVPGILMALHTWTRTLALHPHVHCLVSGGGLDGDGAWRSPKRPDILLPGRVVRAFFTKVFTRELLSHLESGLLSLPPETSHAKVKRLILVTSRRKWNVRVGERYEHGQGVATYLARYMRGGPIKNNRIAGCDGTSVDFLYHEVGQSAASQPRRLRLGVDEFLGRVLEHVPVPRMHVIRSCGLYHNRQRDRLERCREQLPACSSRPGRRTSVSACWSRSQNGGPCRVCGRPLVRLPIPRGGAPPQHQCAHSSRTE